MRPKACAYPIKAAAGEPIEQAGYSATLLVGFTWAAISITLSAVNRACVRGAQHAPQAVQALALRVEIFRSRVAFKHSGFLTGIMVPRLQRAYAISEHLDFVTLRRDKRTTLSQHALQYLR